MAAGNARGPHETRRRPREHDPSAGSWLERLIFEHRAMVVAAAALLTASLGTLAATRLTVNADFEKMRPARHPFVTAALQHSHELPGLGNALQVVVESRRGDIYDPAYLDALREVSDELAVLPGVDRAWVRSLWTPSVRWSEVTEEGFRGGAVMPDEYDGTAESLRALRRNVERAGVVGSLVASDARSSVVFVPLLDRDPGTGAGIDYPALAARLSSLRGRAEAGGEVRVRIVGFAMLVGELLDGMRRVFVWFAAAAAIATAAILAYTRCLRSTALVIACAATGVVWQLGAVSAAGIPLDPFSMLVPFLVFALGVSHGVQKMNGIAQDIGRGAHRLLAARQTFRRLFAAGVVALLTDAVGFAVLAIIDVPAIRVLALTASVGVGALVFTSLVLLPVLLSYTGVSAAAAARSLRAEPGGEGTVRARGVLGALVRLTERRPAAWTLAGAVLLVVAALGVAARPPGGAAEAGAPELRASSRYNRDAAFLAGSYEVSGDVFAVVVATRPEGCLEYRTLVEADRLAWELQQLPGVRATSSLADPVRRITAGTFEGSPKWFTLSRNQQVLNHAAQQAIAATPELVNPLCSATPVVAYLADHRAETLERVVAAAEGFASRHGGPRRRFLLAAGNAGMKAATNLAVREARWTMAACVYGAVVALCLLAFRSWRAVVVTVLPLAATSAVCAGVMSALGIALEISTLPVIALGVGIPDFALYLLTVQLAQQRAGRRLGDAYRASLYFTGRVVVLVSLTLAAGVVTWSFSPVKLQGDMGIMLTLMFIVNMVAALTLVPALSAFLLSDAGREPIAAAGAGDAAPPLARLEQG